MTPTELRTLEIVVAAPHSKLRTRRRIRRDACSPPSRTPGVHILGSSARPQVRGRVRASPPTGIGVFAAAAKSGVAIEIDGDPSRQDIDFALARGALDAGCLFALDSDAHSVDELRYADTALAHARLAGIPTDRIINCWQVDRAAAAGWPNGATGRSVGLDCNPCLARCL